jgi:hypothetical protein
VPSAGAFSEQTMTMTESSPTAIKCRTIVAAVAALKVLYRANLQPGNDFWIEPPVAAAPIHISFLVGPPADVLRRLRAIPDTTIV